MFILMIVHNYIRRFALRSLRRMLSRPALPTNAGAGVNCDSTVSMLNMIRALEILIIIYVLTLTTLRLAETSSSQKQEKSGKIKENGGKKEIKGEKPSTPTSSNHSSKPHDLVMGVRVVVSLGAS